MLLPRILRHLNLLECNTVSEDCTQLLGSYMHISVKKCINKLKDYKNILLQLIFPTDRITNILLNQRIYFVIVIEQKLI